MSKNCITVLIISIIIGFVAFSLFLLNAIAITTPIFFIVTLVYGIVSLLALFFISAFRRPNCDIVCSACCHNMAIIGSVMVILMSLILSLVTALAGIYFNIASAFLFFFLALSLGGLWCMLFVPLCCRINCGER